MTLKAIVHKAEEGGYWAEVPSLPGCLTQGETLDEARDMAKDAILSSLEALREDGEEIPLEQRPAQMESLAVNF